MYLSSVLAGVLSHVPAGLGVLESMLLLLLPHVPPAELLAAVLLYRVIYEIVPLLAAGFCLAGAVPALAVRDYSKTALNIIPSGQWGGIPIPPKADDQARMYDGLTPLFDRVSNRQLHRWFKSEKLGTRGQGPLRRERVPRRGVRIIRDRQNVPHIYGRTNNDVTWGAGWVLAHDRELLLEQARYNARVAVVDAPGLNAILTLRCALQAGLTSEQLEAVCGRQLERLLAYEAPLDLGPSPGAASRRARRATAARSSSCPESRASGSDRAWSLYRPCRFAATD